MLPIEEGNQRRRRRMSKAAMDIGATSIKSSTQQKAFNKHELAHSLSEAVRRGEFNKSSDYNEVKKKLCIRQCMLGEERKYPGNIDEDDLPKILKSALSRGLVSSDSTLGAKGGIKRRSQKKRKLRKSRRSIKKIKRKKNKRPTKKRRR
jgi:hypothetical protein